MNLVKFFGSEDKQYFILHSCDGGLAVERLPYYMYLYQLMGAELNFRYKIASGINCPALNEEVGDLLLRELLIREGNILKMSESGVAYYESCVLTNYAWERLNYFQNLFSDMSDKELHFICLVDCIVSDVMLKHGSDGLINSSDSIRKILWNLSSVYSEENFDGALSVIRELKAV